MIAKKQIKVLKNVKEMIKYEGKEFDQCKQI